MLSLPLSLALRVAAVIVILAAGINFVITDTLLLPPIFVANILFLVSFVAAADEQRMAMITLLLSGVLLVGSVRFWLDGRYTAAWAVMELVVYGALAAIALKHVLESRR